MDKNKTPGISIESVHLLSSCVNVRGNKDDLEFGLAVTSINRKVVSDEELRVVVAFDLMDGVEDPAFSFTATYGICYKRPVDANMTWEEFGNGFVLTHVLPYFREFASSVTLRLPVPALIIPPTNVKALLLDYENREVNPDN